jgi:hypothetical protein
MRSLPSTTDINANQTTQRISVGAMARPMTIPIPIAIPANHDGILSRPMTLSS